ncbi:MAG: hypothetical protein AMJ92_00050 [candidate division Zixibacteria bacterium SM23_81]|nr:MAG: hypothetical protein AMJ92_00050 [candidate division Zixibacteria bacterium SM23_81]
MDAIVALLSHRSVGEAAQAVGIGETTLYRWLQDSVFQEAYRDAKFEVVQQALSQLQQTCGEAADVLREIMKDQEVPPYTRVVAARTILETSIRAVEIDTLVARIEKLEQFIEEQTPDLSKYRK